MNGEITMPSDEEQDLGRGKRKSAGKNKYIENDETTLYTLHSSPQTADKDSKLKSACKEHKDKTDAADHIVPKSVKKRERKSKDSDDEAYVHKSSSKRQTNAAHTADTHDNDCRDHSEDKMERRSVRARRPTSKVDQLHSMHTAEIEAEALVSTDCSSARKRHRSAAFEAFTVGELKQASEVEISPLRKSKKDNDDDEPRQRDRLSKRMKEISNEFEKKTEQRKHRKSDTNGNVRRSQARKMESSDTSTPLKSKKQLDEVTSASGRSKRNNAGVNSKYDDFSVDSKRC
jgi:hypothetical protein